MLTTHADVINPDLLAFIKELWPTAAQRRYEPPSDLARKLGNTQPGDGRRFKGRGPIQITGRANYQTFGGLMALDLVGNPEQAATPEVGFAIAGTFWERKGLNALADAGNFTEITRRINGGQNGAAERERFYALAKQVLGAGAPVQRAGGARAGAAAKTDAKARASAAAADALVRGPELVEADEQAQATQTQQPEQPKQTKQSSKKGAPPASAAPVRVLDARPDTLDFRDLMYVPTLIEVPTHVPLGDYLEHGVPVLDQGSEGACTGFGLATVANYLLLRRRVVPDNVPVSPRMLYELARRYDEWPGEDYSGSSARGAMKGWNKHGVCSETLFPVKPAKRTTSPRPDRRAHLRSAAAPAGRLLPGQPQGHRRDAFRDRRGGRPVRHLHRATRAGTTWAPTAPSRSRPASPADMPSPSSRSTSRASGCRTRGVRLGASGRALRASATTTGSRTAPTSGSRAWARR
jgi:hypothetical protein